MLNILMIIRKKIFYEKRSVSKSPNEISLKFQATKIKIITLYIRREGAKEREKARYTIKTLIN